MIKIDEKYFEDILYKNLQTEEGINSLNERGLQIEDNCFSLTYRQMNLKGYGIPDIVRVSFHPTIITIDIIELKVTDFDLSHLLQLGRYVSGIKDLINSNDTLKKRKIFIHPYLIVAGFDHRKDNVWIGALLDDSVAVYSTTYELDGMRFESQFSGGWNLSNQSSNVQDYINIKEFKHQFKESYKYYILNYRGNEPEVKPTEPSDLEF